MKKFVVAVVVLAACGSVNEQNKDAGAGGDAVTDTGGNGGDGGDDGPPPPCNLSAAFGTPVQVPGVNTDVAEATAWLLPDQLTIFYSSGTSNEDVVVATRSSTAAAFGTPTSLTNLNSTQNNERRPVLTTDGLTMFVEVSSSVTRIYTTTRATTASNFGSLTVLALGTSASDSTPWLSDDGLTLLFSSSRNPNDTSDNDLFRATRATTTAAFGTPAPITELNTAGYERSPVLSKDGLEIFWGKPDSNNIGLHIWHATRANTSATFSNLAELTEISAGSGFLSDYPDWVSPDRCTLLFTSSRANGAGNYDLWMAKRPQ